MINFTVGPVQSPDEVREVAKENVPYFRTQEFSKVMLKNEAMMLEFSKAPAGSRAVFLTCSGTGSMEAGVINTLNQKDKVLVINGGSFGERFVQLLELHGIPYEQIVPERGHDITDKDLLPYENKGFTAFLVNVHETSTGVHYDMERISSFCKRNHLFLFVDAISSFLADEFDMEKLKADVLITGSQKALACHPGISIIVLSKEALERVENNNPHCMYLDLKLALKNQERGQTPFTPAVSVLLQIHARLIGIQKKGGVKREIERINSLARYFRNGIKDLPLEIASDSLSNAVTPLHPLDVSAYSIFLTLKDKYGIWVCPNGGELKDLIFRVGHLGDLTTEDYDVLLKALHDMKQKGKL